MGISPIYREAIYRTRSAGLPIYRNISDSLGTLLWIKNKLWRSGGAYLPSEKSIVLDLKGTCHSWLWISQPSWIGYNKRRLSLSGESVMMQMFLKDNLEIWSIVFSLAVLDNRWRYIFTCTRVDKPASLLIRMLLGFVLTMYLSILLAVFLYKYIQIR